MESEVGSALPFSSLIIEEPRTMSILKAPEILEAPVEPTDPLTSPILLPPPHPDRRVAFYLPTDEPISEPTDCPPYPSTPAPVERDTPAGCDEGGPAVAIAGPPSASPPSLPRSSPAQTAPLEEEEWEIKRIIDKRRKGRRYEYRVRWTDSWLLKSELGNAQRLLREFEARDRAK